MLHTIREITEKYEKKGMLKAAHVYSALKMNINGNKDDIYEHSREKQVIEAMVIATVESQTRKYEDMYVPDKIIASVECARRRTRLSKQEMYPVLKYMADFYSNWEIDEYKLIEKYDKTVRMTKEDGDERIIVLTSDDDTVRNVILVENHDDAFAGHLNAETKAQTDMDYIICRLRHLGYDVRQIPYETAEIY